MIWQLAMLSKADDETEALILVSLVLAGYVAWRLLLRGKVNDFISKLEAALAEETL